MLSSHVLVEVNGLKKYFRAGRGRVVKAVDDVSFNIHRGETLGLVGESGHDVPPLSGPLGPLS
jgi:oligopeptide transport system ATP-binding protein